MSPVVRLGIGSAGQHIKNKGRDMSTAIESHINNNAFSAMCFRIQIGNELEIGFVGHCTDVNVSKPLATLFMDIFAIAMHPISVAEICVFSAINRLNDELAGAFKFGLVIQFYLHTFSRFALKLFR